jgi:manganese oxidase
MNPRRGFFKSILGVGATVAIASAQQHPRVNVPVVTPDISDLPFTTDNGVKVFHLVAEPVKQVIIPGRTLDLWGFNGSAPGPTIQANEGDRIRIVFDNHLPEATGIHWHGLELPIEMDGVPGVGQELVMPGGRFVYEFTLLHQNGTFFYHPHMAMQEMAGMLGGFVIHPKTPYTPAVDQDFLIALQEYSVLPNSSIPNSMSMEFNWLTFNGKSGPASTPLIIRVGERVRIRIINMGMDHHPIHLHGFTFWETGREGARQPETIWPRGNTTLVGVAQARDIEFVACNPGDWMIHCHLPHHMMNSMMDLLSERAISTSPLTEKQAVEQMGMTQGQPMSGQSTGEGPPIAANASAVAGFPQDGLMEMAMDEATERSAEFTDLPEGWSTGMQGMMSLLRVMPPQQYERYLAAKRDEKPKPDSHQRDAGAGR